MSTQRLEVLQPHNWILGHLQMRQIQRLLEAKTGLNYGAEKDEMLRRRIVGHVNKTSTRSFDEYIQCLNHQPELLSTLINDVTINETFMFRDSHQLNVWLEKLIKPKIEARPRFRIWSAACSTGEEPITLAIMLDRLRSDYPFEFEIFASDVNTAVLEKAKQGLFPTRSLKDVPQPFLEAYFRPHTNGYQVQPQVLQLIKFFPHNLFLPLSEQSEPFDFIFLRNVMIYFSDEGRKVVFEHLSKCLRPGGHLLMGHCESPMGSSQAFTHFEEPGTLIYRKV